MNKLKEEILKPPPNTMIVNKTLNINPTTQKEIRIIFPFLPQYHINTDFTKKSDIIKKYLFLLPLYIYLLLFLLLVFYKFFRNKYVLLVQNL